MLDEFVKQFNNDKDIYLKLKVRPNAGRTEVIDVLEDNTTKINIASPALKGRGNQELIKFLAKTFAIPKENVKIISGAGDRIKLIKVIK